MIAVEDRREAALQKLCLALGGGLGSPDTLERSRERVHNTRIGLERAQVEPRCRSAAQLPSRPTGLADRGEPNYFALFIDAHGIVSTRKLPARDDAEATALALTHAHARAFDVWDGWRLIGCFDPSHP